MKIIRIIYDDVKPFRAERDWICNHIEDLKEKLIIDNLGNIEEANEADLIFFKDLAEDIWNELLNGEGYFDTDEKYIEGTHILYIRG